MMKVWLLILSSFFLVAFGQPAWQLGLGPVTAAIGFALFWAALLPVESKRRRFFIATAWFTAVQLVQLSWFISHPYSYIYSVYFLLSLWLGLEFGLLTLFVRPAIIKSIGNILALAAAWVIFEWSRLYVLSGFSWNPVGLALADNIYSLQLASVAGVFALSFWVMLVNLLTLRCLTIEKNKFSAIVCWIACAFFPYAYGVGQIAFNSPQLPGSPPPFTALLVQTAFAPEELDTRPKGRYDPIGETIDEWKQILRIVKKFQGQKIDLAVFPEFVVPFGTYNHVFPAQKVYRAFIRELGPESLAFLPVLKYPFSDEDPKNTLVNNAFWTQGIANYLNAGVLIGLEDADYIADNHLEYFSSALFFSPQENSESFIFPQRYEKRVLVPMGEYIPFDFLRQLAARYGVSGSFSCGKEAKIFDYNGIRFSPSICYEETYGQVIGQAKMLGADVLVNMTNDAWYPNSRLARQHMEHARLRTVENGTPLIRACNTGITCGFDSFGRTVAVLGGENPEAVEWISDALLLEVPRHHYRTLYAYTGDYLLIGICLILVATALVRGNSRSGLD